MKKKKMFLFFSHILSENQKKDAKESLHVNEFIELEEPLQKKWANVSTELTNLQEYARTFELFLQNNAQKGDIVLVQGDFGLTYLLVFYALKNELLPVYAVTKREVVFEKREGEKIMKKTTFEHRGYREYAK